MKSGITADMANGIYTVYSLEPTVTFTTGTFTMNLYDLKMTSITGEEISFSDFKDQALLIVNLASQ
jgi:hypothetical protein